jgi:hypothetical protein
MDKAMWLTYRAVLKVNGPFAASLPKDPDEIRSMLENRMPAEKPEDGATIDELVETVSAAVATADQPDEDVLPGASTFPSDERGLYYEGRCVRGHLKDCALQIQGFFPSVKNFRAKFVNRVYVVTDKIYVGAKEVAGTQERFIQVMTRRGPRSSIKYIDWVESPTLEFTIKLLNDDVITEEHLKAVFEYGGIHGMGGERSQGWGRYELKELVVGESAEPGAIGEALAAAEEAAS